MIPVFRRRPRLPEPATLPPRIGAAQLRRALAIVSLRLDARAAQPRRLAPVERALRAERVRRMAWGVLLSARRAHGSLAAAMVAAHEEEADR